MYHIQEKDLSEFTVELSLLQIDVFKFLIICQFHKKSVLIHNAAYGENV